VTNLPDGPSHDPRHPGPIVLSVNVGSIREVSRDGDPVRTAIWKSPVSGPVTLRGVNVAGDDQADRKVHGGPDKAVYAYAMEDYEFWAATEKFTVHPVLFGENLTVQGIDLAAAVIGERWRIGSALLEVAQPRLPCFKLGIRVGDPEFPKRFESALRTGAYLRIIEEGVLQAGDQIQIVDRPTHGVTIRHLAECVADHSKLPAILAAPQLPANWRKHAQEKSP
jgi:MOSC domain-containing protein YiiM